MPLSKSSLPPAVYDKELSEQVFDRLEDGELIPVKWHAIVKFLDRIKTVYA